MLACTSRLIIGWRIVWSVIISDLLCLGGVSYVIRDHVFRVCYSNDGYIYRVSWTGIAEIRITEESGERRNDSQVIALSFCSLFNKL